jgi:hypothetical protein
VIRDVVDADNDDDDDDDDDKSRFDNGDLR